jgi:hypothetical protein
MQDIKVNQQRINAANVMLWICLSSRKTTSLPLVQLAVENIASMLPLDITLLGLTRFIAFFKSYQEMDVSTNY